MLLALLRGEVYGLWKPLPSKLQADNVQNSGVFDGGFMSRSVLYYWKFSHSCVAANCQVVSPICLSGRVSKQPNENIFSQKHRSMNFFNIFLLNKKKCYP